MNMYNTQTQHRSICEVPIQPATHVRATKGDAWLFGASKDDDGAYLREYDAKRNAAFIMEGSKRRSRNYDRWVRLSTYNAYKRELRQLTQKLNFLLDEGYFVLIFKKQMPRSWSKKKKKLHAWAGQQSKPDLDNYCKAFFDGLMKEDMKIWCFGCIKLWIPDDEPEGISIIDAMDYFSGVVDSLRQAYLNKKSPVLRG